MDLNGGGRVGTLLYYIHLYQESYINEIYLSIYSTVKIIRDILKILHFSKKMLIKPISLIANGFILIHL